METGDEEDVRRVVTLLLEAMAKAQECLDRGGCVLVHCLNGLHRAGFFILGLLVFHVIYKIYSYVYAHLVNYLSRYGATSLQRCSQI